VAIWKKDRPEKFLVRVNPIDTNETLTPPALATQSASPQAASPPLPFSTPLVVNLKTAKALGMTTLFSRAHEAN
jgi:hypothetical protein